MAAKILAVDDSVVDRVIISNMLSDFEVITASDGVLTILANSPRPWAANSPAEVPSAIGADRR